MNFKHLVEDGSLVQQSVTDSKEYRQHIRQVFCVFTNNETVDSFSKAVLLHGP